MTDRADAPAAWRHETMVDKVGAPGMHDIISDEVKQLWLKANPRQVEHYTIPLYAAPPPPAAQDAGLVERLRDVVNLNLDDFCQCNLCVALRHLGRDKLRELA